MKTGRFIVQVLRLSLWGLFLTLLSGVSTALGASPSGVYALSNGKTTTPRAVLDNPNIDGLALRHSWDELEPREGVFEWSRLDAQIAAAHVHGKKVSLGVTAGIHTPAWVYAGGAPYFTFVWGKPWGPPICSKQRIPIPWDPLFLAKWTAFVRELGRRYAENPTVVYVKITGINTGTQETLLPHSRKVPIAHADDACVSNDDVAEWQAYGYSRGKVVHAWIDIANSFAESFPHSRLGLMLVPGGFPPIEQEAQLMIGKSRDRKIALNLIAEGLRKYGSRLVIQNNGLSAAHGWKEMAKLSAGTTNGWQMLWRATNDPSCRMNNHVHPCDAHSVLLAAVDRGFGSNPAFIEIYQADILNPGLEDVVANAHKRLARPGT